MPNTWWMRPINGSDLNMGLSYNDAKQTIAGVMASISAGDIVYLCAESPEYPTATVTIEMINFPRDSGQCTTFIGVNSSGINDGTQFVFDGSSLPVSTTLCFLRPSTYTGIGYRLENIRFTNSTSHGLYMNNFSTYGSCYFKNCRFDNNVSMGFVSYANNNYLGCFKFYMCEFDHNGSYGCGPATSSSGMILANYCSFHHNGTEGVRDSSLEGSHYTNCLFYRNGSHGISLSGSNAIYKPCRAINCTSVFNNGHGIYPGSYGLSIVYNSILAFNNGHAFFINQREGRSAEAFENNCVYGNSEMEIRRYSLHTIMKGINILREDPNFVSTIDGSENFTPQNSNLLMFSEFPSGGTSNKYVGAIKPNPY